MQQCQRKMSNLVADILADHTLLCNFDAMEPLDVLPAECRKQGHRQRNGPYQQNHRRYSLERPLLNVVDACYRPVPATGIRSSYNNNKKVINICTMIICILLL